MKTPPRAVRLILAGACALFSMQAAVAAPALAACDGPYTTTLAFNPATLDARAVWLDAERLRWPGAPATGIYKLYASASGAIVARAGAPASGFDQVTALRAAQQAIEPPRFHWTGPGVELTMPASRQLHRSQLVLVREDETGRVLDATRIQAAGALDALFADAAAVPDLGVSVAPSSTTFKLWAPTAQQVAVCVHQNGSSAARTIMPMQQDEASGVWRTTEPTNLTGAYYSYLVDVVADGAGLVRNKVTDPYAVSLTADSTRAYIADLAAPALKPALWDAAKPPATVAALPDMTVYELHVRDFSINDASVPPAHRGKYAAFSDLQSNGMRHLAALARAGMTDIHLLPIYDIGSVPERGCVTPRPAGGPASEAQQAVVMKSADTDCFNWGYDPFHYNAPEGSYASDAADGARRIVEVRQMVASLHKLGLRVGMDVVYNHTYRAGQNERSVLDRIVPGYYHRLDPKGAIAESTCCANTATENAMMGKLMTDSVVLWASQYHIDSFRFDLMGHQPRAVMEDLQRRVNAAAGRPVQLIGEGWNFGEVADGARFVQASQLSLGGSGIGSFSDRGRDALRGGGAGDSGADLIRHKGFLNGAAQGATADMVKLGLAGSLRDFSMKTADGAVKPLSAIDYGGQPAGYASIPGEAVNYVENHDNQTLYDINAFKLPRATSSAERARVQMLGAAVVAFSQGVAYYHAGIDTLRSKSLDRNSFNSGDWFNRLDWSYRTNYFGTGLPPAADNGKDYALLKPLLADARLRAAPADIAFARDVFRDLLAIRASSTLFRMRTAADVQQRLRFMDSPPTVIAARLDGEGYAGAGFGSVCYFVNADTVAHTVAGQPGRYRLHPAQKADARVKQAKYENGRFTIPPRTAVVFVE